MVCWDQCWWVRGAKPEGLILVKWLLLFIHRLSTLMGKRACYFELTLCKILENYCKKSCIMIIVTARFYSWMQDSWCPYINLPRTLQDSMGQVCAQSNLQELGKILARSFCMGGMLHTTRCVVLKIPELHCISSMKKSCSEKGAHYNMKRREREGARSAHAKN